jgi:hypothetical protein
MDGFDFGYHVAARQGLAARATQKLRSAVADLFERQYWRRQFEIWDRSGVTPSVLEVLDLEPGQIDTFITGVGRAKRLLSAMLERLGLPRAGHADLPPRCALLRVCAMCPNQKRCAKWLDSDAITGFAEFCPNTSAFIGKTPARVI